MTDSELAQQVAARKLTTPRKHELREHFDDLADERAKWHRKNQYFYEDETNFLRFIIPARSRVLELGCGNGRLLASLGPSVGVGVDMSPGMIRQARASYPELTFIQGDLEDPATIAKIEGPFDYIVISDTIGYLEDIQAAFQPLHKLCTPNTRVIVTYFSQGWRPILRLGELLGQKMPSPRRGTNWLSSYDISAMLSLVGFETVKRDWRVLIPRRMGGIGALVNRAIGTLPGVRRFSLRNYVIARPEPSGQRTNPSCTVVIPCRNEAGNIEPALQRLPRFCEELEVIYVEGNSSDDTVAEIQRVIREYGAEWDIRFLKQDGRGKADAVWKGFDHARGEVLVILDADLTVPPEDLPKFYDVIASGRGEFVNGTRLVYPLEPDSMRRLNYVANHFFARVFSWLLNQRLSDTLCGTKMLSREHYHAIKEQRSYFGYLDPFGDFDLLFGATKLNLRIVEVAVRYDSRSYGEPQISRFRDGWQLLKMVSTAWRKLKAF